MWSAVGNRFKEVAEEVDSKPRGLMDYNRPEHWEEPFSFTTLASYVCTEFTVGVKGIGKGKQRDITKTRRF